MKNKITVSQIRKVAELWKENNRITMEEMRGSPREFYRGFLSACLSFQDLIDGKIGGATEEADRGVSEKLPAKYFHFGRLPDRLILPTDEYKGKGNLLPLKWTAWNESGRRTEDFTSFIYRRKITLTKGGAGQKKGKS